MRDIILKHKKGFMLIAYLFLIFIGCCTFPVINLTRNNYIIYWYNTLISVLAYYEIGLLLRVLYEDKHISKVALMSLCFTIIGYVCRFFLELGEVSNTYNFTAINIIIHTFVAVGIPTLVAIFRTNKKDKMRGN